MKNPFRNLSFLFMFLGFSQIDKLNSKEPLVKEISKRKPM